MPVNFYLKSAIEQQNIIFYFASYLKIAPDNLQVKVVTQKADIAGYVTRMRGFFQDEPSENCRQMIEDNIREVTYLAANEAVTRRFRLSTSAPAGTPGCRTLLFMPHPSLQYLYGY